MDSDSQEKKGGLSADGANVSVHYVTDTESMGGWDQRATRKLLRKLDLNIIPFMSLIYLFVSHTFFFFFFFFSLCRK